MSAVLPLKEVLNLLPAALRLPFSDSPDSSLYYRVDLPALPFSLLGLLIAIQETKKSELLNTFNPQVDCLPVFTQSGGDSYLRYPLFVELPTQSNQCLIRHVHILYGLSDFYGNIPDAIRSPAG